MSENETPNGAKTITVSWHPDAVQRAVEHVTAIVADTRFPMADVRIMERVPVTWQDLVVLRDMANQLGERHDELEALRLERAEVRGLVAEAGEETLGPEVATQQAVFWLVDEYKKLLQHNEELGEENGALANERDEVQASRQDWAAEAMRLDVELEQLRPGTLPTLVQPWATEIRPGLWAVRLTDDANGGDWEPIAAWVGGELTSFRDATDEDHAAIVIPRPYGPREAYEDWWVLRNEAGGRYVASPSFFDQQVDLTPLARKVAEAAYDSLDETQRAREVLPIHTKSDVDALAAAVLAVVKPWLAASHGDVRTVLEQRDQLQTERGFIYDRLLKSAGVLREMGIEPPASGQKPATQAITGEQLDRLHRFVRDLKDAALPDTEDDNLSTEQAYNRGYTDGQVDAGKTLEALLDTEFMALLDHPRIKAAFAVGEVQAPAVAVPLGCGAVVRTLTGVGLTHLAGEIGLVTGQAKNGPNRYSVMFPGDSYMYSLAAKDIEVVRGLDPQSWWKKQVGEPRA